MSIKVITDLFERLGLHSRITDTGYICPFHTTPKSKLTVERNRLTVGGWFFSCSHPRCNFRGNVIDFIKKLKKLSAENTVEMFMPGNILAGTVFPLESTADRQLLVTELYRYTGNIAVNKSLEELNKTLLDSRTYLGILMERYGLTLKTVRTSGLFLLDGAALPEHPEVFKQAGLKKKDVRIGLPFFNGDVCVSIELLNPETAEIQTLNLEQEIGWFPRNRNTNNVTVCPDGITALALNEKLDKLTLNHTDFVAVNPGYIKDLKSESITVLAENRKAITGVAAMWCSHPEASVMDIACKSTEISAQSLLFISRKKPLPVADWLADNISADNLPVFHHSIPATTRTALAAELAIRNVPATVLERLKHQELESQVATYGNIIIERKRDSYVQLAPVKQRLSNFVIIPDRLISRGTKSIIMGKAVCDGKSFPVELKLSDLTSGNGVKLANLLWESAARYRQHIQPFAAGIQGLDWLSIIRMFEAVDYAEDIGLLGTSGTRINFPRFSLDTALGKLDDYVCNDSIDGMYSAYGHPAKLDNKFTKLKNIDSLSLIIYAWLCRELSRSIQLGSTYDPEHLILPYFNHQSPEYQVLENYSRLLNGSKRLKELDGNGSLLKKLNGLPGLFHIKNYTAAAAGLLRTSPSAVIATVPSTETGFFSAVDNCTFLQDSSFVTEVSDLPEFMLEQLPATVMRGKQFHNLTLHQFCVKTGLPLTKKVCTELKRNYALKPIVVHYRLLMEALAEGYQTGEIKLASSRHTFYHQAGALGYFQNDKVFLRRKPCIKYALSRGLRVDPQKVSELFNSGENKNCTTIKGEWCLAVIEWQRFSGYRLLAAGASA